MFYSEYILTKKGPLAKVWLAAHMQSKLTKSMVFTTNVSSAVARIMSPDAPMALRLTSNLLLGVVRILSRKAKYLLADSTDALAKLNLAHVATSNNDLQDSHANPAAITLADTDEAARARADPVTGLPEPLLEFPDLETASQPMASYLADKRDITIADRMAGTVDPALDFFERDPDLDLLPSSDPERNRNMSLSRDLADEEPLIFTPSQVRASMTPEARRGQPGESVERMRDAAVQNPALETPRISLGGPDDEMPGTPKPATPGPDADVVMATPQGSGAPQIPGLDASATPRTPGAATADRQDILEAMQDSPPRPELLLPDADLILEDAPASSAADRASSGDAQEADEAPARSGSPSGDADPVDSQADNAGPLADAAATEIVPAEPQENIPVGVEEAPVPGDEQPVQQGTAEEPGSGAGAPSQGPAGRGAGAARKRKTWGNSALWDRGETELSATFFRDCLQDTSDITQRRKRVRISEIDWKQQEEERGLTARDIFSRPAFPGFAAELQELFATCFNADEIFKDPGSPILTEAVATADELDDDDVPPRRRGKGAVVSRTRRTEADGGTAQETAIVPDETDKDGTVPAPDTAGPTEEPAHVDPEVPVSEGPAPETRESSGSVQAEEPLPSAPIAEDLPGSTSAQEEPAAVEPPSATGDEPTGAPDDQPTGAVGTEDMPSLEIGPSAESPEGPRPSLGAASSVGEAGPLLGTLSDNEAPLSFTPVPAASAAEEDPVAPEADVEMPIRASSPPSHEEDNLRTSLVDVSMTRVVVEAEDGDDPSAAGEARLTTRALKMRDLLEERLDPDTGKVDFGQVLAEERNVTRRVAARSFYELLNLCSKEMVTLSQPEAFGSISVTPCQPLFGTAGRSSGAGNVPEDSEVDVAA